jgi:hypothetical protein
MPGPRETHICKNPLCGATFYPRPDSRRAFDYCKGGCKQQHESWMRNICRIWFPPRGVFCVSSYHIKCLICGKWTIAADRREYGRREICKEHTSTEKSRYREKQPIGDLEVTCACGKTFTAKHHGRIVCLDCDAIKRRRLRVWHENVDPIKVFRRDKWVCQHCGCGTPEWLRGNTLSESSPELDHVLPIAHGGAHSYVNTQCLCRACNSVKGDRIDHEPRLLGINNLDTFKTARYPPQPTIDKTPRTCDCGCGLTYKPWQQGNAQYKTGHWQRGVSYDVLLARHMASRQSSGDGMGGAGGTR